MPTTALNTKVAELVDNFGYKPVSTALANYKHPKKSTTKISAQHKTSTTNPTRQKPNAVTVVEAMPVADTKKREFLQHLACDYEAKRFMPNISHVRGFLQEEHQIRDREQLARIKSRQQATVRVFTYLASLEIEKLHELELCGLYAPPKRLATYVEAIGNFQRPRQETTPCSSKTLLPRVTPVRSSKQQKLT